MIAPGKLLLLSGLMGAAACSAAAHVGFIIPDRFEYPDCSRIGAIASFSDRFPSPEIALVSDSFSLIAPDGGSLSFDKVASDHALTRLEGALSSPGAYLLTSGERLGRKSRVALVEGRYVRLDDTDNNNAGVPEGAEILSSQTETVSEAYISCGGKTEFPDSRPSWRLTITPDQLQVRAGTPARFTVRFDGAPLATPEAYLLTAYRAYAGEEDGRPVVIGADGLIEIHDLAPGIHVLLVRHIAPAPEGADTDVRSYSTALTFDTAGK